MSSSAHAQRSIPYATKRSNERVLGGAPLMLLLLGALLAPPPCPAADEPRVLPAPPELLSADIAEEPAWDRAALIREIREEERKANLEAVRRARAEAEREARSAVLAELEPEMRRLRDDLETERRERASAETLLETARAELDRSRGQLRDDASARLGQAREVADLRSLAEERGEERDAAIRRQEELEERLRSDRVERDRLQSELRERESRLKEMTADLSAATEELQSLRSDARSVSSSPPERASCDESVQEAVRKALVDCEREWRQRARAGEDAMQASLAMKASLEGLESENRKLRRELQQLRDIPPAADAGAVQEAYDRGRRDAQAEWDRKSAAASVDEGLRRRIGELEGMLQSSRRELATALGTLADRDEEIDRLEGDLEEAARSRPVPAEAVVSEARLRRDLEQACEKKIDRALEEERSSCLSSRAEAEAEANRRAVTRLDELYQDIQAQTSARVERARKEERAEADRAFRAVLRVIEQREDRKAAREIWEKRD